MRLFMTKAFARFARRENISSESLCEAVRRAERGLIDADLGNGVIKQRIACGNRGRSAGLRTIILFRKGRLGIFAYGYAKRDRANIDRSELKAFRLLAREMLAMDDMALAIAVRKGTIMEIPCDDATIWK